MIRNYKIRIINYIIYNYEKKKYLLILINIKKTKINFFFFYDLNKFFNVCRQT